MTDSASLQFGITIRAWSLIFAAEAFVDTRDALHAIDLLALRARQGTLRVALLRPHKILDPFKAGIAAIPLELLLSFRDTVIDSALEDAEKRHLTAVEAAHDRSAHRRSPFSHCLAGELCEACKRPPEPQIDFQAISRLLSNYSLALVARPSTPLLTSPPYTSCEPKPWVVALATHNTCSSSTPSSGDISFFSPSFMRITSADIMRFRNLVRTWRLVLVDLPGPVTSRGASRSRCASGDASIPGAMIGMEFVKSLPSMGHCEPKWMLLHPQKGEGGLD